MIIPRNMMLDTIDPMPMVLKRAEPRVQRPPEKTIVDLVEARIKAAEETLLKVMEQSIFGTPRVEGFPEFFAQHIPDSPPVARPSRTLADALFERLIKGNTPPKAVRQFSREMNMPYDNAKLLLEQRGWIICRPSGFAITAKYKNARDA